MMQASSESIRGRHFHYVWATVLYAIVMGIITFPLVTQIGTHIAGASYADSMEYLRLGWWTKYALQNGLNPFYQSLLTYPTGFVSSTQLSQPLIYWPFALFNFVTSPVASFNLWFLAIQIGNGLAAYWLCRRVILDQTRGLRPTIGRGVLFSASWIGGLIFMISPAMQGHSVTGHINPISNYALPIFVWAVYRILFTPDAPRLWRTAIIGGIAAAVFVLGNFTGAIYSMLPINLIAVLIIVIRLARGSYIRRTFTRTIGAFAVLGIVWAAVAAPFYAMLVQEALFPNPRSVTLDTGAVAFSTDAGAFAAFSPFTPYGAVLTNSFSRDSIGTNSTEGSAYLGLIAVMIAAFGLLTHYRHGRFWLLIVLVCAVFSLGPLLKWRNQGAQIRPVPNEPGYATYIPMPWAAFQSLPLIRVTRTPGRFNLTTMLGLGVLTALGLSALLSRLRFSSRLILPLLFSIGIILEYQLFYPFPTVPGALPRTFYDLRDRTDVRAVIDLPFLYTTVQKTSMYQQTAHEKPILGGYVSRRTDISIAKQRTLDAMAGTGDFNILLSEPPLSREETARYLIKSSGADVLVGHPGTDRGFMDQVFGAPLYADPGRAIYNVPTPTATPDRLVISTQDRQKLALYAYPGDSVVWLTVQSGGDQLVKQDGLITRRLPAGKNRIAVAFTNGYAYLEGMDSAISLNPADNNASDGDVQFSASAIVDPVKFGDLLTLTAAHLDSSDPARGLLVDTAWTINQRLVGDYRIFIHVVGSDNQIAAQQDVTPGGTVETYTEWRPDQRWNETIGIDIQTLTPGTYQVFIGMYRLPELINLPISEQEEARLSIGTITIP